MRRFLIVKTSSIGDVLQSFHVLDYLKHHFPNCRIDWVVEKEIAPLVQSHPSVSKVHVIQTRQWRKGWLSAREEITAFTRDLRTENYETLFDLQGNTKSAFVTFFSKAEKKVGYDWKSVPEKPNYFVTNVHSMSCSSNNVRERYLGLVQEFFEDAHPFESKPLLLKLSEEEENRLQRLSQLGFQRPRIMICFGANWKNKRLTEQTLEEFIALIDEKFSPSFFFIFGNEEEKEIADRLERRFSTNSHSVGGMSLPLWQRFMNLVEVVVAMDSAALHLCATTQTPSFGLFGPSSASAYKPLGEQHGCFQGTCPYGVHFEKRCPYLRTCHSGDCLQGVSAEEIFEKFQSFFTLHAP
jgi:heptosyltransferase I